MRLKKFLLGVALPISLAITVVGTGFAIWYFGEMTRENADVSVKVAKKVPSSIGSLKVTFGEEGSKYYAADGEEPKLIVSQTKVIFPSPVSVTFTWATVDEDSDLSLSSFLYTFEYKITLSEVFSQYFQLYQPVESDSDVISGYWDETTAEMTITDFSTPMNRTFPFSAGYKSGKAPATHEAYRDLRQMLIDEARTTPLVSFEFTITAKMRSDL